MTSDVVTAPTSRRHTSHPQKQALRERLQILSIWILFSGFLMLSCLLLIFSFVNIQVIYDHIYKFKWDAMGGSRILLSDVREPSEDSDPTKMNTAQ